MGYSTAITLLPFFQASFVKYLESEKKEDISQQSKRIIGYLCATIMTNS